MKKSPVLLFVIAAFFAAACSSATTVEQTTAPVDASEDSPVSAQQEQPAAADPEDAADTPSDEPVAAAETAAETDTETAVEDDSAPTVDTSSAASLLGSDDWCTVYAQVDALDLEILTDPDALEQAYTQASAILHEAVGIAPPAIAADVAQMAEASVSFIGVLEDADWDFLAIDVAAIEEVAIGMDEAGDNIETYNYEVCGIGEDPGDA